MPVFFWKAPRGPVARCFGLDRQNEPDQRSDGSLVYRKSPKFEPKIPSVHTQNPISWNKWCHTRPYGECWPVRVCEWRLDGSRAAPLPRGHRVSPVCRGRGWFASRLGVVGGWRDAPPSTPPWVPDRGPARRSGGDALKQPRWLAGVASVDGVSVVCSLAQLEPRGDFVLEVWFPLVFSRPV